VQDRSLSFVALFHQLGGRIFPLDDKIVSAGIAAAHQDEAARAQPLDGYIGTREQITTLESFAGVGWRTSSQVLVDEAHLLAQQLSILGRLAEESAVRHRFEDMQLGLDPGAT
jgi:hypothetical protein